MTTKSGLTKVIWAGDKGLKIQYKHNIKRHLSCTFHDQLKHKVAAKIPYINNLDSIIVLSPCLGKQPTLQGFPKGEQRWGQSNLRQHGVPESGPPLSIKTNWVTLVHLGPVTSSQH